MIRHASNLCRVDSEQKATRLQPSILPRTTVHPNHYQISKPMLISSALRSKLPSPKAKMWCSLCTPTDRFQAVTPSRVLQSRTLVELELYTFSTALPSFSLRTFHFKTCCQTENHSIGL